MLLELEFFKNSASVCFTDKFVTEKVENLEIKFSKYNGAGNDFIVIDDRVDQINNNSKLIQKLCDRNFGIGGDGLILIKESKESDFEIIHYTSDGNLGSLCGNGSRYRLYIVDSL